MPHEYDGDNRRTSRWHDNGKVSIAVVIAIVLQTGGGFWWAGTLSNRVSDIESDVKASISQTESASQHRILQLQIDNNKDTTNEIKGSLKTINGKLDRLIERK